jgi:hypothetical protein
MKILFFINIFSAKIKKIFINAMIYCKLLWLWNVIKTCDVIWNFSEQNVNTIFCNMHASINTNFIVFGLIRLGLEPTIYRTRGKLLQVNYMIPTILCIIIFLCFQTESYVGPGNLEVLIVLLVLYGYVSFIYDQNRT